MSNESSRMARRPLRAAQGRPQSLHAHPCRSPAVVGARAHRVTAAVLIPERELIAASCTSHRRRTRVDESRSSPRTRPIAFGIGALMPESRCAGVRRLFVCGVVGRLCVPTGAGRRCRDGSTDQRATRGGGEWRCRRVDRLERDWSDAVSSVMCMAAGSSSDAVQYVHRSRVDDRWRIRSTASCSSTVGLQHPNSTIAW
jgi:hypothetical protein